MPAAPVFLAARPTGRAGRFAAALDARLKLAASLAFGVLVWRTGGAGLTANGLLFLALLTLLGVLRRQWRPLALAVAGFTLFWGAVKLGLDVATGIPAAVSLPETGLLCGRLAVLILLGCTLAVAVTPRALGLGLAALFRPFSPRRAWEAALALTLMIHFVPICLDAFAGAREALRRRNLRLSRRQRFFTILTAGFRMLAQNTWHQTLAVAARRLDGPDGWVGPGWPPASHWLAGAALIAWAVAASLL